MQLILSKRLLPVIHLLIVIFLLPTPTPSSSLSHSCLSGHKRKDSNDQVDIVHNTNMTSESSKFKQLLFKALKRLSGAAKNTKKLIEKDHLKTKQLKRECKKRTSALPQMLERISEDNVAKSLAQVFKDFRQLTIMSYVIATAASDNVAQYQDDLNKLKTDFAETLCYAETLADNYRLELYQGLSNEDMLKDFTNMTDQTIRDRRNCMFMKEISQLLNRMKNSYK